MTAMKMFYTTEIRADSMTSFIPNFKQLLHYPVNDIKNSTIQFDKIWQQFQFHLLISAYLHIDI